MLAAARYSVEGRRVDLLLASGFFVTSLSAAVFAIGPRFGGRDLLPAEAWSALIGAILGQALIAIAPFSRGRSKYREWSIANAVAAAGITLFVAWSLLRALGAALPDLSPLNGQSQPFYLTGTLALQAFVALVAVVGWGARFMRRGDDLARWLALGFTLMLFAALHLVFQPLLASSYVSQSDFLRMLAYIVILAGAWRAIQFAEFGRAVAEERARVAREIHDGLAQYLFAVFSRSRSTSPARSRCRRSSHSSPSSAGARASRRGDDLARWLALGFTLMLFAALHLVFQPLLASSYVSQSDFLRMLAYIVILVGAWRAIQFAEFGRAVAEERARVAREIHDGLAQYLFAVSTHATMLENGAPLEEAVPRLKEAALLAQQEARFAILALSSASGTAPFDAALRRYVDVLTADGGLEVELEVDGAIRLAPDEQIEIFRIVQEGLANVRKHANATRAEVTIGQRPFGERFVNITDDGDGFDGEEAPAGQGLKNIRARAESIEGGFSLRSTPRR